MTTAEILEMLSEEGDEGLLKADGLDDAIIGLAEGWFNNSQHAVIAYDFAKCVDIFIGQGMTEDDALEWMYFNVIGAYVGPTTPVFIRRFR